MSNTKTPTNEAERFKYIPKNGIMQTPKGNFEIRLDIALSELPYDLTDEMQMGDIVNVLDDLRTTFIREKHTDMTIERFQGYIASLDLAKHFFQNLITRLHE